MTNQQIIDEARRLVDGDDVPLWAVAAALQLGYTGDGAVLHVAQVVLKWHDLHGNDRLAVAERVAKEMQEVCIGTVCYQCACGRELIDGHWHQQGTETLVSCGAWDIRKLDPDAIARRAVDGEELR